MSEDEAIKLLSEFSGTDLEHGNLLLQMESHISADKFGNLWEAFVAAAPIEVVMELDQNQVQFCT